MMGLRKYYFKSWWNLFDFAILDISFIDFSLDLTIIKPKESGGCEDSSIT